MDSGVAVKAPRRRRLIAVCGKGGSGKTALSAMMAHALLDADCNGRLKILLIDADPASCLPGALGMMPGKTIGEVRSEVIRRARVAHDQRGKDELARNLDYLVMGTLVETDRFSLLVMGSQDERGCFCPVNRLLRGAIEYLSAAFDVIIIDGEAGIEQINRQVMRGVDAVVVVSDATAKGIGVATTIARMVQKGRKGELTRVGLVVNRVPGVSKAVVEMAASVGCEVLGFVPEDPAVSRFDMEGKPLLDLPSSSPSMRAVEQVVGKLGLLNGG